MKRQFPTLNEEIVLSDDDVDDLIDDVDDTSANQNEWSDTDDEIYI